MKRLLSIALLFVLFPLTSHGDDKTSKPGSLLMQRKLEYSQKILAGLAEGDFDAIEKNAKIMSTFTQLENWFRSDTPRYDAQLRIFRFANDDLIRQANAKNLEGASLAYVQLTLSCVNCHKVVRDSPQK